MDFIHFEVGRCARSPVHCHVLQLVQRCRLPRSRGFAKALVRHRVFTRFRSSQMKSDEQLQDALLSKNCSYKTFLYKTTKYCDLQQVHALFCTRTHWSALKKWTVWVLLLNSQESAPHFWLQSLHPNDTCNAAHPNTFILFFKFYCAHTLSFPLNFDLPEPHISISISPYLMHD